MEQATSKPKSKKGRKRGRGSVQDKLAVTSEVKLKASAPAGSRFRGYEDVLVQDLKITVKAVRYRRERWETAAGERIVAPLPPGILGRFGPELRRFIAAGHFQGEARIELVDWPRIIPEHHRTTPCNAGFGPSRFSSPARKFRVLYAAQQFRTALAEAVIRDRFVGKLRRYLYRPYLEGLAVTEISSAPLNMVDLSGEAAYEMGIDTDAKGSRAHSAGQKFAEELHKRTMVDGIIFESWLTGAPCVAVFDRAFSKLSAKRAVDLIRVDALADESVRLGVSVRRSRTGA